MIESKGTWLDNVLKGYFWVEWGCQAGGMVLWRMISERVVAEEVTIPSPCSRDGLDRAHSPQITQ
jgi:hypothetical protein